MKYNVLLLICFILLIGCAGSLNSSYQEHYAEIRNSKIKVQSFNSINVFNQFYLTKVACRELDLTQKQGLCCFKTDRQFGFSSVRAGRV